MAAARAKVAYGAHDRGHLTTHHQGVGPHTGNSGQTQPFLRLDNLGLPLGAIDASVVRRGGQLEPALAAIEALELLSLLRTGDR